MFKKFKREDIMKGLKFTRRRMELVIAIFLGIIVLGQLSKAMITGDFSRFHDFSQLSLRTFDKITREPLPISILFFTFSFFIIAVINPVKTRIVAWITIAIGMFLAFVIPEETIEAITTIKLYLVIYSDYVKIISIAIIGIIFSINRSRKFIFRTTKYAIEILLFTNAYYFTGIQRSFDLGTFLKSFWNLYVESARYIFPVAEIILYPYAYLVFLLILISVVLAVIFHIKEGKEKVELLSDEDLPTIGICIPAYNEERTIIKTLKSLQKSNYPTEKIYFFIISDGSVDNTIAVIDAYCNLKKITGRQSKPIYKMLKCQSVKAVWESQDIPNLIVIDKKNGGKADALNLGIQFFPSSVEYVGVVDSDTTISEDTFKIFSSEAKRNKKIVALTGTILPREEFKKHQVVKRIFTNWQCLDYLSSFHVSRGALSLLNAIFIVSGALTYVSRYSVLAVRGYKKNVLGEDVILTLELQESEEKGIIKYIPQAVAYTQVPTSISVSKRQRIRWFKGLTDAIKGFWNIWKRKPVMGFSYLYFFIVEWFAPLLAPISGCFLLANPEAMKRKSFLILIMVGLFIQVLQAVVSIIIEKSHRKISFTKLFYLPFQIIMVPFLILWRVDAFLDYSSKEWGRMTRS